MTPQQAAEKYHWVKYNSSTNTIELYLDNFMLSNARICEAKFYLEHILHISPRYDDTRRKPWWADFGEYMHWCLEEFYGRFKIFKAPPNMANWLEVCKEQWFVMNMDYYKDCNYKADVTKYEDVGGWTGVAGLLTQYYAFYMDMRVRVIDTEISFGYNKEVYLGNFKIDIKKYHVPENSFLLPSGCINTEIQCYLTGRIDLLVDNGYKIGPVDHKTTHRFDGNEHNDFNPHDGLTGYILAINDILNKYREQGITNIPMSTGGWIYHISSTIPSIPRDKTKKQGPRFKTTPIDKNKEQLEDYKARQLSTFKRIAELLFNSKVPEWNTVACNNIFNRPCEFKHIHEQPSSEWPHIIKDFYVIGENIWDTRKHGRKKEETTEVKS